MNAVDEALQSYIEARVLPRYACDSGGHDAAHIAYVIRRSLLFAKQFADADINMVYAVAAWHDIGCSIDRKRHEIVSAQMFMADEAMRRFFSDEQRLIIKHAIEDHRASAEHVPRSIYGRIVSSADRSCDVDEFLRRTHAYTLKYEPCETEQDMVARAYAHTQSKYGSGGYAKHYVQDEEYAQFLSTVQQLLQNKALFAARYKAANGL